MSIQIIFFERSMVHVIFGLVDGHNHVRISLIVLTNAGLVVDKKEVTNHLLSLKVIL